MKRSIEQIGSCSFSFSFFSTADNRKRCAQKGNLFDLCSSPADREVEYVREEQRRSKEMISSVVASFIFVRRRDCPSSQFNSNSELVRGECSTFRRWRSDCWSRRIQFDGLSESVKTKELSRSQRLINDDEQRGETDRSEHRRMKSNRREIICIGRWTSLYQMNLLYSNLSFHSVPLRSVVIGEKGRFFMDTLHLFIYIHRVRNHLDNVIRQCALYSQWLPDLFFDNEQKHLRVDVRWHFLLPLPQWWRLLRGIVRTSEHEDRGLSIHSSRFLLWVSWLWQCLWASWIYWNTSLTSIPGFVLELFSNIEIYRIWKHDLYRTWWII